jgi:streptomycin 6-kinase
MIEIPAAVTAMAARGPQWAAWVDSLPATVVQALRQWQIRPDGRPNYGHCSLVIPVRTADGSAAMLKVGFPEEESEHEHLALRRWGGQGAVRLLGADPHRQVLLLERLAAVDLTGVPEAQACAVVAGLYRALHVPALPALRPLSFFVDRWTAELTALPRSAPIPHRLVEQAVALGRDLVADRAVPDRVIHTDLHYGNVLAGHGSDGQRQWLAIDPKPVNGDPHYEIAPMLWNRWDEICRPDRPHDHGGEVREGVRRRLWTLVDASGFDDDRARAWVLVRMMHNAMWAAQASDRSWLTLCITIAKAVQD